MTSELHVSGPAWYCDQCRAWWAGAWGPLYLGEPPDLEQQARDLAHHAHIVYRTCAECGEALRERTRTVAIVTVRTAHDDDDTRDT